MHKHLFGTAKSPVKVMDGVYGFWKNGVPGGLGFHFETPHFTSKELDKMFGEVALSNYIKNALAFHGSEAAMLADMKNQLDEWGAQGTANMDVDTMYYALMNIIVLTERKAIVEDEYNGSVFRWKLK